MMRSPKEWPGRCSKEMADVVASIDALMFQERPSIRHYTEYLRTKIPEGSCDLDAVRAVAMKSPHFRWHKISNSTEVFRFASSDLVSEFQIYLNSMEIPKLGCWIRVKKTEEDYE